MNLRRVGLSSFLFLLVDLLAFAGPDMLMISSPAFSAGQPIPAKYALANRNISPRLGIKGVPAGTQSLVLIVEDPDAPSGIFYHWLVWNLPPDTTSIAEGSLPKEAHEGTNSFGRSRYDGPAPPSGTTHRYDFWVYALDVVPDLPAGSDNDALTAAMKGHIIGRGATTGTYHTFHL